MPRIGVIHNPAATNAHRIKEFERQLFDAGYDHAIVPTSREVEGTMASIAEFDPRPNDVFAVHAGDGGYNNAVNAVINLGLSNIVIPTTAGKACDNARSYYREESFLKVLQYGVPAKVHPLELCIDTPNRPETTQRALGYFGLNGTVSAVHKLDSERAYLKELRENGPEFTAKTRDAVAKTREALMSLRAVVKARPITAVYDGHERLLADLSFCNISRYARECKIHADPFDSSYFRRIATPAAGHVSIGTRMLLLKTGLLPGDKITGESEVTVSSESGSEIPLHIAGETKKNGQPLGVPSQSTIRTAVSGKFFWTHRLIK